LLGALPFSLCELAIFAGVRLVSPGSLQGGLGEIHSRKRLLAFALAERERIDACDHLASLHRVAVFSSHTQESSGNRGGDDEAIAGARLTFFFD
jgi:hypothetical protein